MDSLSHPNMTEPKFSLLKGNICITYFNVKGGLMIITAATPASRSNFYDLLPGHRCLP